MITRPRWQAGDGPDGETLDSCLREHLSRMPRLNRLRRYYDGRNDVLRRTRDEGLPNNRLAHAFPRYIVAMASGYLIGSPVTYQADDPGAAAALEGGESAYGQGCVDSVDVELARNASIYGRGVELVYADDQARPRSVSLDPCGAFVVYDDTVAAAPLFGVYYAPVRRGDGVTEAWRVHVFTDRLRLTYRVSGLADLRRAKLEDKAPHWFGGVPLVEYWNDECERGDFEPVLTLIDAYDALASDRMNDKQQFVDALLVLYGCTMEPDAQGRSPGRQLREDRALALPDSDARVEWLCKQLNETDTEVLRRALKDDIHKMSLVPDLTDAQFAGNASGVAMRYKLLGLEQLIKGKERWFREGLRQRLALYGAFLRCQGAPELAAEDVRIAFSRALPVNELEIAQTLSALRGLVDDEALRDRAEAALNQN